VNNKKTQVLYMQDFYSCISLSFQRNLGNREQISSSGLKFYRWHL